jgi:hypothetical protein
MTLCLIDGFWVENPFRRRPGVYVCVCLSPCLLQLVTPLPSPHLYTQLDNILHYVTLSANIYYFIQESYLFEGVPSNTF